MDPQPLRVPASESFQTLDRTVLAKAQPDECYLPGSAVADPDGVGGVPGVPFATEPINPDGTCPSADLGYIPKVNEAYVWGMAEAPNGDLFWGTAQNVHCLVMTGYLGQTEPVETPSYSCALSGGGDSRPPSMYRYIKATGTTVELTVAPGSPDEARLVSMGGFRSAGEAGGVIILAGPRSTGGINLFAFNAATGELIESDTWTSTPEVGTFTNIRRWTEVGGSLYAGVGTVRTVSVGPPAVRQYGGGVVRWTGSLEYPLRDEGGLPQFELVSYVDTDAAEVAAHDDRLMVSTWPPGGLPGMWMSPELNGAPLPEVVPVVDPVTNRTATTPGWQKVWESNDYEPYSVVALAQGMGAMRSYGGYLYWGTMHVPGSANRAHETAFDAEDPADDATQYLNTHRAISIFRATGFDDGTPDVELLYGERYLPVYYPAEGEATTGSWGYEENNLGQQPRFGPSGFGNPFNNYAWALTEFNGDLFVGTMDFSYLALEWADAETIALLEGVGLYRGADLWRFDGTDVAAVPESLAGVGNYTTYGVRNMLSSGDELYLGMANPMNRLTDKSDAIPEGGWELIRLTVPVTPPPVVPGGGETERVRLQTRSLDGICPASVPDDPFTDVGTTGVHRQAIRCLWHWGLTLGTTPTTYSPELTMPRDQMATFLVRLLDLAGVQVPLSPPDAFTDDEGNVHELAINQLAALGLVRGTGGGLYAPLAPVTRAQMATFITNVVEYLKLTPATNPINWFKDDEANLHHANINMLGTLGITGGVAEEAFDPNGHTTRAQMASFIARTLDLLVDSGLVAMS